MSKKFEVRYADVSKPKLKIGVSDSVLKVPYAVEDPSLYVAAAEMITERINEPITYRGRFGWRGRKIEILMAPENPTPNHPVKYFAYDSRVLAKEAA